MTVALQIKVASTAVPEAFYDAIQDLEVEESSDQPGALMLRLPVNRTSAGDLQFVGDGTFEPLTNISLTVTPASQSSRPQCVFDGYVLSWRLHLDRATSSSMIDIWAQDASWLMNLSDSITEWPGYTDAQVAEEIFGNYGITPADANDDDDSPSHTDDGHTLMQRGTDLQFLRGLARRAGKLCRVACTDTPGERTGYFATPAVDGDPVATISFVDPDAWTVDSLDFDWDVMRPSEVDASQVDLTQSSDEGTDVSADSSGLTALDQRDYATYLGGQDLTLQLTTPADVPDLDQRTAAVLTESGFFVRCTGEVDADRIGTILRVGTVVTIEGAGNLHSGNWLVWNVRHRYTPDSWKMNFTLVRNAVGPPSAGGTLTALSAVLAGTGGFPS